MKQYILFLILIGCSFLVFSQVVRNKEIVRERFGELRIEIDMLNNQLNQSFFKDFSSPINVLFEDKYWTSNEEKQQLFMLFSYGLLWFSPDYDTILQTGIYYEGQESGGFYNTETFMDSIKNIYYTYSIADVQRKGRNQYDVCIKGTISYRGSHWEEEGENVFIRGPFRMDVCYPFVLKNGNITINSKKLQQKSNY